MISASARLGIVKEQMRQRLPECCAQCGKRQVDDGVKLLSCARRCGQWYCGKTCQLAAWQGGHKRECYSMAFQALEQALEGMGGGVAAAQLLESWLSEVEDGEGLAPEQLDIFNYLLPLSRTVVEKGEPLIVCIYVLCLALKGTLAMEGAKGAQEKDVAGLKAIAEELEAADVKYGHLVNKTPRLAFLIHRTVHLLLADVGTPEQAVARGRRTLPRIEQLVARGDPMLSRRAADYMLDLAKRMCEHARELQTAAYVKLEGQDGQDEGGVAANLLGTETALWREAEVVAKRALALAEEGRAHPWELCLHLARVSYALQGRGASGEVVVYSRRVYELAPDNRMAIAAENYGVTLLQLGRCTEAEKVLRRALEYLRYWDVEDQPRELMAAKIHTRLGQVLLKLGRVEEALEHAMHARAIHPPVPLASCSMLHYLYGLYMLGGDALEKLGRRDEAREWDMQGCEYSEVISHSAERRQLEDMCAEGQRELAVCSIRRTLQGIKGVRKAAAYAHLPDEADICRIDLYAEILEGSTDPEDLKLAVNVRADVEESRAILAALREAVLVQTREEAALAAQKAREERAAWLGTTRGSTGGRRGKQRGKGKKRGPRRAKVTEEGTRSGQPRDEERGYQEEQGRLNTEEMEGRRTEGEIHVPVRIEDEKEIEAEEEEEECAICFLDLEGDGEEAEVALLCGHRFHAACVDLWVNNCRGKGLQVTCPMCRADLQQ